MTTAELLGRHLATIRDEAGLTQEEAASKSGLTKKTIEKMELGRTNPNLKTLEDIASAYSTDLGHVFYPWTNAIHSKDKPITDVMYRKLKKVLDKSGKASMIVEMIEMSWKEIRGR